ncbi:hypothetical protein QBC46DRAFT_23981 [Diplogelasinospora grovesii]|uniref:Lea domain protein n=1 Tax=Diplogelasinospora grovesii TaxID=303347 RepID=A0AAN6N061_9PEZI|nr:hypothetical protein QBC46DRAFT_23981 [Diplogelasinospora grovesii]
MTSKPDLPGGTHHEAARSEDDIVEVEREHNSDEDASGEPYATAAEDEQEDLPSRPKSPAYVAPIPKIGSIPSITPGIQNSPDRPKLPPIVGNYLVGKTIDEFGDIVDPKTGQVLARAGGDLPEIVGRKVSNAQGDILDDNGELLGYVADLEIKEREKSGSAPKPSPRSLFDIMGRSNSSLMVDHMGNILDSGGNVVGKFHDNNNPLHREAREKEKQQEKKAASVEIPVPQPQPQEQQQQPRPPMRTEDERRQNAEAWRKENPGESPSDIFLDVKSTTEGIQLTIRIPTVFGGQQVRPNISFS